MTSRANPDIYLLGPRFALGDILPISKDLPRFRDTRTDTWKGYYSRCQEDVLAMAAQVGRAIVEEHRAPIDRIFICSESFWDPNQFTAERVGRLKSELGCPKAHTTLIALSFCNNFHSALEIASIALRATGGDALVLLADRCGPEDTRIVGDALGVLSDGAAGFILTRTRPDGQPAYRVLATALHSDSSITLVSEAETQSPASLEHLATFVEIIKTLKHQIRSQSGLERPDYVVTCNFRPDVIALYASLLTGHSQAYNADIAARYSHVFSSDVVISLAQSLAETTPGQTVLAFTNGPQSWGMSAYERV